MWPLINILSIIQIFKFLQKLEKVRGLWFLWYSCDVNLMTRWGMIVDTNVMMTCPERLVEPRDLCRPRVPDLNRGKDLVLPEIWVRQYYTGIRMMVSTPHLTRTVGRTHTMLLIIKSLESLSCRGGGPEEVYWIICCFRYDILMQLILSVASFQMRSVWWNVWWTHWSPGYDLYVNKSKVGIIKYSKS